MFSVSTKKGSKKCWCLQSWLLHAYQDGYPTKSRCAKIWIMQNLEKAAVYYFWFLGVRQMSPAYSSRVEHLWHHFWAKKRRKKRRKKKTQKKDTKKGTKKRREKKTQKKDAKKRREKKTRKKTRIKDAKKRPEKKTYSLSMKAMIHSPGRLGG